MGAPKSKTYGVVIAGGGPAGSSLAIRLASAGMSVLVAEQKRFPREKLCGEFISPECLPHFEELGILQTLAAESTKLRETVFYARSGRSVSVESEWFGNGRSAALGLSRARMDTLLLERCRDVGAEICEDVTASGLLYSGETVSGVRLRNSAGVDTEISARLVVDATGRTRSLARKLAGLPKDAERASHVAFKTHLTGAKIAPGACEIYSYSGGYGGCNAVEDGYYNVCFIASAADAKLMASDAERVMREVVFTNPRAKDVMKDAVVAKPWLAVPIQRFGRRTLVPQPGLLTVGDSAAFIDPFTGSGILLALQSSKVLADAIERHWQTGVGMVGSEYQLSYSAAFDRRLRWCSMLRYAAFDPRAAELMVAALGLSTPIRKGIARLTRLSTDNI